MSASTESSKKSLSMILKEQPYLYDLHTHLLGMGNAGFWIDTILMDEFVMPTNQTFKDHQYMREALCPLIWDKDGNTGFVDGKKTAEFFHFLVDKNLFRKTNGEITETMGFEETTELLKKKFSLVLCNLVDMKLYQDLIHGGLEFKDDFSYDVILTLSDLGKGLGIQDSNCEGFIQLAVTEKLGGHLPKRSMTFQHWIIFNARKQKFDIVYGIQVDQLRKLICIDPNQPSEAAKLARAHIINAFSMCDAEGTRARPIDLHSFHGFFTPEFYPRRFALKDSIYCQRLDVLAALIAHIIERYQRCLPPVNYCELSISVNDLSKQWVFDVLRSVRIYDEEAIKRSKKDSELPTYTVNDDLSSFSQIVLNDHFPHLQVAFKGPIYKNGKNVSSRMPHVTYKFLAGFDRRKINLPFPENQDKALDLLYLAPHEAIMLMMEEIKKSQNDKNSSKIDRSEPQAASLGEDRNDQLVASTETKKDEENAFDFCLKQLEDLKKIGNDVRSFYKWVVGLDLFGDELGYPYCPFVARQFIKFVQNRRKKENKYFGVRIHCGENVKYATDDNPTYRMFIGHMYIVFRCLLFLHQELKYGIRIGHGIAFNRILSANLSSSRYRKSSVLMAEMHNYANYLFKKIAFEVNITSNEYLLGQRLRQGDYAEILRIKPLFNMKAPIVLATDDDGIWPIDQCSSVHPGHQSLAAEYCRAISTSLINVDKDLKWTFETMKKFCFWNMGNLMQKLMVKHAHSNNSPYMNPVIVHPDIIRLILKQYTIRPTKKINPAFKNFRIYPTNSEEQQDELNWTNQYGAMCVAFVCICTSLTECNKENLREEYDKLFDTPKDAVKEFDFIYDSCENILADFVICKTGNAPQITLEQPNQNEQKHHAIYSMEPSSSDISEFLKSIRWSGKEINIRAYAKEMNIKDTLDAFDKWHSNTNNKNSHKGTLLLFTNTNKYTYAYSKLGGKFELQLNPHASKRETTDENFLYVLCRHASAATAALHLISERISKFADDPSTIVLNINNPILFGSAALAHPSNTNDKPAIESAPPKTPDPIPEAFNMFILNNETVPNSNPGDDHDLKRLHSNDNDDRHEPKRRNTSE